MSWFKKISQKRRLSSLILCTLFVLSSLNFGIIFLDINVSADLVNHTNGNLDIEYLTDMGRIFQAFNWNGFPQTVKDSAGFGYIGLVVDHDGYNHIPNSEDIADSFTVYPYPNEDDFKPVNPISMIIDDGNLQKSTGSYRNEGAGTGSPLDIKIKQTAWTQTGSDWAILQWTLTNIKIPSATLTNVCLGLEIPFSKDGGRYGVGGEIFDGGDDVDGFDSASDTYWVRDTDSGINFGVASALSIDPISHYYGEDYYSDYSSEYRNFFSNDTWLYERIHAPSATATDGVTPGNITTTLGWNGMTLSSGESKTLTMIFAVNNTYSNMLQTISDAKDYYHNQATRFFITEIEDSEGGSPQIEVFNFGRPPTDVSAICSLSANSGTLTGSWSPSVVPTYGYSVFTPNENIDSEGDTIRLYDTGVLVDSVSFGRLGETPDPLVGESVARYYDPQIEAYSDTWTHNTQTGPTWGFQNDVPGYEPSPSIVLNEVMFNPSVPDGGYVILMNIDPINSVNITGYQIVGDTEYTIPNLGIILNPQDKLIIGYSDDPPGTSNLFDNLDSTSDNIYLYDDNEKLLDMAGWNTAHIKGMSMRRDPDGFGTHKGYNDITSQNALWSFNSPLEVLITEFSDGESVQSQIEVYNPFYPKIDFSVGFSTSSDSRGALFGSWSTPVAQSNEYAVYDISTPNGLGSQGDTFRLLQNGILIEEVSYGQKGKAPDPLPDESVQRVFNLGIYSENWSRNTSLGPNFGAQNNVLKPNFNSTLILNEILFNPNSANDGFVELYLLFSSLDISGYRIVGNTEFIIPSGTVLSADDSFFYLIYSMNPAFFTSLNTLGDNIYLYDDNGVLLDMMGWSSQHIRGKSACRIPDGNGLRDGYDDTSSTSAGWVFDSNPSIQFVKIISDESTFYGNFSQPLSFVLTLENKQSTGDSVYILNFTENGYPVEIFDETGSFKITEIIILANLYVNITVRIELPDSVPFIEWDNITIIIESKSKSLYRDSSVIKAVVSPFIWLEKYPQPQNIYIDGTGYSEISTITLNLSGLGSAIEFKKPQEVIFCVDTSGSMSPGAIDLIKIGLIGYVDKMESPDKGAVVVFNTGAWIMNPLTDDYTQLKNDINNIPPPGGSTYMGEALQVANNELITNGNSSFIQVIILLTDGNWNGFINPIDEAIISAANNITIFTIGLEPALGQPPLDETLLRQLADMTGGQYFYADDASQIPEIYILIAAYIGNLAGRDIDITDSTPMVRDVLPPWIVLVPGSFSINPETNLVNSSGYRILEWNISQISIGEKWQVTFQVKSTRLGWVYSNDYDSSRVYYVDYFDSEIFKLFPECLLNVSPPPPLPPKLFIDILPNKEDIFLYWEEPITPATDHYLIYRAQTPTGFDFSTVWIDTSLDIDPIDPIGIAVGNRLSWNHTGAADPTDSNYEQQWYYCIRSVNSLGEISSTSRTVGKWTRIFNFENSTFSLPLEPMVLRDTEFYCQDMNANYIKWMDPFNHIWIQHDTGEPADNTTIQVGLGYEVNFQNVDTVYTFLGMPGSHIKYGLSPFIGFDSQGEADSLQASVNLQEDVTLTWVRPAQVDSDDIYNIYRSTTRDGFFDGSAILATSIPYGTEFWIDLNAARSGTQLYYMIIPENELGEAGGSSYSIGVWTARIKGQYDTLGIPLIPDTTNSLDWFCDQADSAVGMNYFIHSESRWGWHSTRMPEGAYDPELLITHGYQISTSTDTKLTFIGR